MPKTTKLGSWKDQGDDGTAREGAGLSDQSVTPSPNVNALKADWVEYAVEVHGADRDEAEATNKDDLIATYG